MWITSRYQRSYSISLITREIQVKTHWEMITILTDVRCYQWDNKCQQGCGDCVHCWWDYKLVQPLWKIRRFPQKIRARNAAVRENLPGWCVFEEHTVERKTTWSKDIHRLSGSSGQPGQGSGRKTGGSEARCSGVDASRRPFGSRHRCKVMAHANAYQNAFNVRLAFNGVDKIIWIVSASFIGHINAISHRLGSKDSSYARTQKHGFPCTKVDLGTTTYECLTCHQWRPTKTDLAYSWRPNNHLIES